MSNEAATGEEGLRLAASQPPDLVILDLGLPDIDGQEVLRRLREWLTAPDHRAVRPRPGDSRRSRPSTPAPTTT